MDLVDTSPKSIVAHTVSCSEPAFSLLPVSEPERTLAIQSAVIRLAMGHPPTQADRVKKWAARQCKS